MTRWLRGKRGCLAAFIVIAILVLGGLARVTQVAIDVEQGQRLARWRLEREREQARAQEDMRARLRVALWRLDSRVSPILAAEAGRPYGHYSALYSAGPVVHADGHLYPTGSVLEPSPLLQADLPDWILLHFQVDSTGWSSPEAPTPTTRRQLINLRHAGLVTDPASSREQLLEQLRRRFSPALVLTDVRKSGPRWNAEQMALLQHGPDKATAQPGGRSSYDYQSRAQQQARVMNENQALTQNAAPPAKSARPYFQKPSNTAAPRERGASLPEEPPSPMNDSLIPVRVSLMLPMWLRSGDGQKSLVVVRLVQVGTRELCQGLLLDVPKLQTMLADEVDDLFPHARIQPVDKVQPPHPERTMTALPLELIPDAKSDTGLPTTAMEVGPGDPGWTPLRLGLGLAWAAALIALLAVGLGGWSLLDFSERRMRFVSAVTHELRTPLTTLRLYLDMLAQGMVRDEEQKQQYIQTLNVEADRLNRLVGNVLDFSRLENQRPQLMLSRTPIAAVLEQVRAWWAGRCMEMGKQLIVEDSTGAGSEINTDMQLVVQVLANLIDNACKYSRDAEDRRVWLRARCEPRHIIFEVEDRGPGVPACDRRSVFRAFRRGRDAAVTAGGVGLGLALAQRWAGLLGGRLELLSRPDVAGACFRFTLPVIESHRMSKSV